MGKAPPRKTVIETDEQKEIFAIRRGRHIVIANAGTGKTFCCKEIAVRLYEDELARYCRGRTPTDTDRRVVLRQFLLVTFTVKAAEELNTRFIETLKERGHPEPRDKWGRPIRICRTLDSYLQQWLSIPRVFDAWLTFDNEFRDLLEGLLKESSEAFRDEVQKRNGNRLLSAYRTWDWTLPDGGEDMLLDLICRAATARSPIPGLSISKMVEEWQRYLKTINGRGHGWNHAFWAPKIALWRNYNKQMHDLSVAISRGLIEDPEAFHKAKERVAEWNKATLMRREVSTMLGLARVRNYHPVHAKEEIASRFLISQLAASDNIPTLKVFQKVAEVYFQAKRRFYFLDFTDNLINFVKSVQTSPSLMERDEEYPRYSPRAKYVIWDESQDNNGFQFDVLNLLTPKPSVPYLTLAVGDIKQSIYSFRGATPHRFVNTIERIKAKFPDRIHTLTRSFRSARKIVELGNQISTTLPSYKSTVTPSTASVDLEGEIIPSPPLFSEEAEAQWVLGWIDKIRNVSDETIMIISRTDPEKHPLYAEVKKLNDPGISFLTIHKSKGLEADSVFLLGAYAGNIPDPRSFRDQEANLFYVACTRPRNRLFISVPTSRTVLDENGQSKEIMLAPSPFISEVPLLRQAFLDAGWPETQLSSGVGAFRAMQVTYLTQIDNRRAQILHEASALFGDIDHDIDTEETIFDQCEIAIRTTDVNAEDAIIKRDVPAIQKNDSAFRDRAFRKFRRAFLRNNEVPIRQLSMSEFRFGLAQGWIAPNAKARGRYSFTPLFEKLARSQKPVPAGAPKPHRPSET